MSNAFKNTEADYNYGHLYLMVNSLFAYLYQTLLHKNYVTTSLDCKPYQCLTCV